MKGDMPIEVQALLEDLIRIAKAHKVALAGFAFRVEEDPFFVNFGTVSDMGKIELYEELCQLADSKRAQGNAQQIKVGQVQ